MRSNQLSYPAILICECKGRDSFRFCKKKSEKITINEKKALNLPS